MITIEKGIVWKGTKEDSPIVRTIVIDGPLITHICDDTQPVRLDGDVHRIDASAKFILPGLINCYTHICFDGRPSPFSILQDGLPRVSIKAAESATKTLMHGVTTMRDLGGLHGIDIGVRDSITSGVLPGPRMLVSGQVICITGGHLNFMGYEADGSDEVRKGVRKQLKLGADLIKVIATGGVLTKETDPGSQQLTVQEMRVAVEEAERAGKRVACHAHGNSGILNGLSAGVHSIEHGTYLDEKLAEIMAKRKVFYTPTMIALQRVTEKGEKGGSPGYVVSRARELIKQRIKSLLLAYRAGVDIIAGTDAGTPGNPHGDMIDELKILKNECMTTKEVLVSATSLAAKALGIEDKCGTLEEGKIADLIIVDGNPLDDLEALRRISFVIKEGKVFCSEMGSGYFGSLYQSHT